MIKLILAMILGYSVCAQAITATVTPDEVALEDSFKLSINFEYQGQTEPYVTFKLNNGEIVNDNTNEDSRVSVKGYFAGNKVTQRKIYNYVYEIRAIKTGTTVVRDIKVDFGSKVVNHRSLSVRVKSQRTKLQDYFVRAEVDKTQAYVGEPINLNYYVYFKGEITNPEFVKFPVQKNFLKRFELPRVNVERVSVQGEVYKRILLYRSVLYPEKAGNLSVDPLEIRIQYPDYKNTRGNAFGMSFSFSGASYKTKILRSDRTDIKAIPVPTENMPKSFTGLVGSHQFRLTLNKSKVVVNDVLEARLEIDGDGALEKFDAPILITSNAFEVFETRSEMVEKTPLIKNKVFDYTFLAKKAEFIAGRKVELSTFNPVSGQFETSELQIDPLVIMGTGTASNNMASDDTKAVAKVQKAESSKTVQSQTSAVTRNIMSPIFKIKNKNEIWMLVIYGLGGIAFLLSIVTIVPFANIFSRDPFKQLRKNFSYHTIFHTICKYAKKGDSLSDKVDNLNLSSETRKYFKDLIDNASKNEYKGAKLPLKYVKKHWVELLRVTHENN